MRKQTRSAGFIVLFIAVLNLVIFGSLLRSGAALMTTDDNIGVIAAAKQGLPRSFLQAEWHADPLAGVASGVVPFIWTNWWMALLSSHFFSNWIHAISLSAASLIFYSFLQRKGLGIIPSLLGVCIFCWLGSNFTLTYAGHIPKFSVLFLCALTLLLLDKMIQSESFIWAVCAGGGLGLMLVEQQDLALFFGLLLGAFALFSVWRSRAGWISSICRLVVVAAVAFLIAAPTLLSSYKQNVTGVASVQESLQQKWEFCTQWSWPPEESIDFIAPGYTGWRSGEPDGPYWGRMGRSAGWESTRQGFMNFKLENTYIGFIPIAFALFALLSCRRSPHRAEILFWSAATGLALLLAFGKYFPLYNLFWHLPVVNNIRNPNKFLQVFQLGLAVLAAYGMDALFKREGQKPEDRGQNVEKQFFWCVTAVLGMLVFWSLSVTINRDGIAAGFAALGWPAEIVRTIVANQSKALWHAAFMAGITALVFAVFSFKRFEVVRARGAVIAAVLVLIVAADAVLLSKHYVKTLPQGYIEESAVTKLLKEQIGRQRTAMVTQDGFYNIWLTYLFPYQQIAAFNITQMPRMPQDYKQFLETVGRNPLRMWQLSGVGFLLGPSGVEKQLPADRYQSVLRYDVMAGKDGSLSVLPNEKGSQTILRSLVPAPRYALVGGCEKMDDKTALTRLSSNDWKLFDKVILPLESSQPDPGGHGSCGKVDVLEYRSGRVLLKVHADSPGFLRAADKYDPEWKAQVDGVPATVLRADFIFQAVFVPAGVHEVELKYSPENKFLWFQFAGMAVCAVAAICVILPKKKKTA